MEMEKQFIDLVNHVFTLDWVILAIPLSLVLCVFTNRVLPGFILAAIAVVVHHVGILVLTGATMETLPAQIQAMIPKLEPVSLLAEYIAYSFLIIVFSLTRQDMMRPGVTE
jgi:hypothetical protein